MKNIFSIVIFLFLMSCPFFLFATTIDSMPQRKISSLNIELPFIGLGTVELGRDWGIGGNKSLHPQEKLAKAILHEALQYHWTLIDTASSYQLSEERIGRYLPKEKYHYFVVTKPGEHSIKADHPLCKKAAYDHVYCLKPAAQYDFSRTAIFKDVEESLNALHVKTLDIVLLHLKNEDANAVLAKGEAINALEALRYEGKIRYIGVSVNGDAALTAAKMKNLNFLETEYSLINQKNAEAIKIAHDNGMGVIVRGGLGTGLLTPYVTNHLQEKNLPYGEAVRALIKLVHYDYDQLTALSLAFLYQNPNITTVIIGADQPEFIKKDLRLLMRFHNPALLEKAKALMKNYTPPKSFTESMGEYYFKKYN